MTIEGYIRKRPDVSYWMAQIQAGDEFRKKFAYEAEWDKWRAFYRGNWSLELCHSIYSIHSSAPLCLGSTLETQQSLSLLPSQAG